MKILAKGNSKRIEELKQKLSSADYEIDCMDENTNFILQDGIYDAFFDLSFDEKDAHSFTPYVGLTSTPVFVCAVKNSLAGMLHAAKEVVHFPLFGINSIDTFINRNLLEVSIADEKYTATLATTLTALNWEYKIVADRVGMVTPRVVCMIINEACYTLQEGTATMADIDISMKLGTNYPLGPFEWADKIGVKNVYEVLEAVYNDTHDERYKICPLLKTKYLRYETFFN
ncbi:MAG: 3-hydroxyacyl-CoA dehydrogenase family protein [Bacteroidota bacterium]